MGYPEARGCPASRDESGSDFSELQPYYGTSTRQKVIPVGIGSETV